MRDRLWVAVAVFLLAGGFLLQKSGLLNRADAVVAEAVACDLRQGGCEITINNQVVLFEIVPHDIKILEPLSISLKSSQKTKFSPKKASVEFEGLNMDMGYNRVFLEPIGQGEFKGTGMIPACTAETMHWLIHLLLETESGTRDFQFDLTTTSLR